MLFPSALACDSPQTSRVVLVSPPASPPTISLPQASSLGNIMDACRSLQALMALPSPLPPPPTSAPTPSLTSFPTPPMAHAPPPLKLRFRTPDAAVSGLPVSGRDLLARRRVVKPHHSSPSDTKRRRIGHDGLVENDGDRDDVVRPQHLASVSSSCAAYDNSYGEDEPPPPPSTPKRARIAPEQLPLGLTRSDFHDLNLVCGDANDDDAAKHGTDAETEVDGVCWSVEDDRILVELVLDKLRLSKAEWQDCARSLGKNRHSLGRRWQKLLARGDVGLTTRAGGRRARVHATWR